MVEKIIQVSGLKDHNVILTKSGKVYTCGRNNEGQLGIGFCCLKVSSFHLIQPKHFNHEKIIQVCAGADYSLALSQEGSLYIWGNILDTPVDSPKKVKQQYFNHEKIKFVESMTHCFSCFVLTETNKMYAWGSNKYGQLALGDNIDRKTPQLVDSCSYNNQKIKKIQCGTYFTLILTQMGKVYACGINRFGCLGLNHCNHTNLFQQVGLNSSFSFGGETIKDISASTFSLALTQSGKIYSWGLNSFGQLGFKSMTYSITPYIMDMSVFKDRKIEKIICSTSVSYAITNLGRVYAWGETIKVVSGMYLSGNNHIPKIMDMQYLKNEKINFISGNVNYFGLTNSLILLNNGKLFVCGNNKYGQFGLGHYNPVKLPIQCHINIFSLNNQKMYQNESFEDVEFEFK